MPTIHLLIQGKVQGVFFRASAKEKAEEVGVRGWVKNTDEGDVELVATGTEDQLEAFVQWCGIGPAKAEVTNIIQAQMPDEDFEEFRVVRR